MTSQTILGKTLREHIGGRYAISWVLYAINVPLNFLAIATSIRNDPQGSQWWGWAVVGLAGIAAIAVGFIVADLTLLRRRREKPAPIWVVAAVGAMTGIFRGGVVVLVATGLQLQPFTGSDLANRMVAGGLLGALALPIGSLVLSVLSTYRSERDRLVQEKVSIERARLQQQGQVDALRTALVVSVRQEVTATLEELDSADPRDVSEALRHTSHRVWRDEEPGKDSESNIGIREVLWPVLKGSRIPVWPAVVLWGVSAAGSLIAAMGPVVGILNLAYSLTSLWICLTLANRWIAARPRQWTLAVGTMIAAAYLLVSPLAYVIFDPRPAQVAGPVLVLNAFWLPIVVGLVTVGAGAITSSEVALQRLSDQVNAVQVSKQALDDEREEVLRELAVQLHGTAHSPLVAGSALLSHVDDTRAREQLLEQVGRAVAKLGEPEARDSLTRRLRDVARPWEGLVSIRMDLDEHVDEVSVTNTTRRAIERIVKEGIANAYRHGNADAVEVLVQSSGGEIHLDVLDNGSGLAENVTAGLGHRLFQTATSGEWGLSNRQGGGAHLRVLLRA